MTNNLRHWEALERTDPNHTKPFDRGRFKGTATKPIWNERRLTEHFGPCGIGWGMDKPEFTIVPAADEIAVFCTVTLWYKDGETTAMVYGVGGDKVLAQQRNGAFVNDESYKAAFTDALGNAMKHIGVNADIHMGRFDDHKYVRELREEFNETQSNIEAPTRPAEASARSTTTAPLSPLVREAAPRRLSETRDAILVELADPAKRDRDILHARREDLRLIHAASIPTFNRLIKLGADRIMHALEIADATTRIDGIMRVHKGALELIKDASEEAYNEIMRLAGDRRSQLIETDHKPMPVGSLMGEP